MEKKQAALAVVCGIAIFARASPNSDYALCEIYDSKEYSYDGDEYYSKKNHQLLSIFPKLND